MLESIKQKNQDSFLFSSRPARGLLVSDTSVPHGEMESSMPGFKAQCVPQPGRLCGFSRDAVIKSACSRCLDASVRPALGRDPGNLRYVVRILPKVVLFRPARN